LLGEYCEDIALVGLVMREASHKSQSRAMH
jgi:hypothetical protein